MHYSIPHCFKVCYAALESRKYPISKHEEQRLEQYLELFENRNRLPREAINFIVMLTKRIEGIDHAKKKEKINQNKS